jgi:EpsI family protein
VLTRAFILSLSLVCGSLLVARAAHHDPVPPRQTLAAFPLSVATWEMQASTPIDARSLAALRVDDYVNRVYVAPNGSTVGLYVGYYRSQAAGTTMHSPLNCLPGAGWEPVSRKRLRLSGDHVINRLTIQKGLDRQVVLYWYQSHGRVVASEYWGKVYTVIDAIRLHRSDAAMVRVIAPVAGPGQREEEAAEREATQFALQVFPLLSEYLPD